MDLSLPFSASQTLFTSTAMSREPRFVLAVASLLLTTPDLTPQHSRILVTGGTGFLRAHIVDLLLKRGIRDREI